MNKKVIFLVVGVILAVVALALVVFGDQQSGGSNSYSVPAPSSNPNDPAVKDLNLN